MLPGFNALVEERILKAQKSGELDNLPGEGKPLKLDDMSIPEEFRMAYRILKNSGFLPPEVEIRNQIKKLELLLQSIDSQGYSNDHTLSEAEIKKRSEIQKKLDFLLLKVNSKRGDGATPATLPETYRKTMLKKISINRRA